MKTVQRTTLLAFLEETFKTSITPDVSYNGLQFEGRKTISKVVTGVDASAAFFAQAASRKADFAIVHHGLFWKGGEWKRITRFEKEKCALLMKSDVNLYALHLPLDSHPELGNNAVLSRLLGLLDCLPFSEYQGQKIGIKGTFSKPITRAQLEKIICRVVGPLTGKLEFGAEKISSLGIVSGGGWGSVLDPEIAEGKLDALLTGELIHQAFGPAQERKTNVYAAGHYATERFGVMALGERLASQFGITHEFIDLPTGL